MIPKKIIPPDQTGKKWKMSEKGKNNIRLDKLGKKFSDTHKKNISEAHKGIKYPNRKSPTPRTNLHKERLSKALKGKKGKKHSIETKMEMSRTRKGRKASIETRKKMSLNMQGRKNRFWQGGINTINMKIRRSLEYKLWREAVFERDNYTCIWCGAKSCKGKKVVLNADHIQLFSTHPELRFAIDNGRTLCKQCHYKRHSKKIYA